MAGIGFLILIVAVFVANWSYQRSQDAPVREAFEEAQAEFSGGVTAFLDASTTEEIRIAGARMETAVPELTRAVEAADARDSDLSDAITTAAQAELRFAEASAALSELSTGELASWVTSRDDMTGAATDIQAAGAGLEPELPEMAAGLPDVGAVVPHLETVIGEELSVSASASLRQLFDDLEQAKATVDLRQVATRAADSAAGIRAALPGLPESSQQAVQLAAVGTVYDALAGLSRIDGEHLADWASVRAALNTATSGLGTDESLRGSSQSAARAVDQLVSRARETLRSWRSSHTAAVKDQRADLRQLKVYRDAMGQHLDRYGSLRADLSTWIDRVDDPSSFVTWDEAYSVLSQAEWSRVEVRDAMNEESVPGSLSAVHNRLVAVIDDGIAAVQAAYQGASDSQFCIHSCYYKDTPGWQRFSSESSRITKELDAAIAGWRATAASTDSAIRARQIPQQPRV